MLTAEYEAGLDQVRNYDDALRAVQHFFRDTFVRRIHDLLQHIAGILQALHRILFSIGERHAPE